MRRRQGLPAWSGARRFPRLTEDWSGRFLAGNGIGAEAAWCNRCSHLSALLNPAQATVSPARFDAPLVIAKEKLFFEEEGLDVKLEAQANWKILLDRVISGELDGAHMLAGQPIGATIGFGTKAHIITPYSLDYNGNGITVANDLWKEMQQNDPALRTPRPSHPIKADSLVPIVAGRKAAGNPMRMGMVFPVSTHNYEIRYWLAASGIRPGFYKDLKSGAIDATGTTDADVLLSVTPPPQMPATLEAKTIEGYCVGEPWNQQAVIRGIGVPVTTNYDIWKNNPEKVMGLLKEWADENPQTAVAIVKALIRAGMWLDETDAQGNLVNREEAGHLIEEGLLAASQIPLPETDGYRPVTSDFIDGKTYDAKRPIAYINSFKVGLKDDPTLAQK